MDRSLTPAVLRATVSCRCKGQYIPSLFLFLSYPLLFFLFFQRPLSEQWRVRNERIFQPFQAPYVFHPPSRVRHRERENSCRSDGRNYQLLLHDLLACIISMHLCVPLSAFTCVCVDTRVRRTYNIYFSQFSSDFFFLFFFVTLYQATLRLLLLSRG